MVFRLPKKWKQNAKSNHVEVSSLLLQYQNLLLGVWDRRLIDHNNVIGNECFGEPKSRSSHCNAQLLEHLKPEYEQEAMAYTTIANELQCNAIMGLNLILLTLRWRHDNELLRKNLYEGLVPILQIWLGNQMDSS